MNVAIIGTGAYGLALSRMFLLNGCNIIMWTPVREEYEMINKEHCNKKVLPNYKIDESISVTMDIKEAITSAKLIVIAVPVKYLRSTMDEMKNYYNRQHICVASKGMEQETYLFPYSIISRKLKTNKIGIISGGTFAVDMIENTPLGLVVASKNRQTAKLIKRYLSNDLLKIDILSDVLGTEIWGSIKNIMAIGCGIIDGMNYPESSKSLFFTKCFQNIMDFVYEFGGNKKTAISYAGIGDLYLTCTSSKSRNYTFGKMIGKRDNINDINTFLNNTTVEGYYTLKSFYELIHSKKVEAKLIDILYSIIYKGTDLELFDHYLKS